MQVVVNVMLTLSVFANVISSKIKEERNIFLREGKCTLILKTTLVNNSFVLWDVSKTVTNDRKKSEETWEGEVEMFQWIKVSLFL